VTKMVLASVFALCECWLLVVVAVSLFQFLCFETSQVSVHQLMCSMMKCWLMRWNLLPGSMMTHSENWDSSCYRTTYVLQPCLCWLS